MADNRVEVLITGDASGLVRAGDAARQALGTLGQSASSAGDALASSFTRATSAIQSGGLKEGLGLVAGGLTKIAAPLFALDIAFKAINGTIGAVVESWAKYTDKVAAAETASLRLTALFDGNAEAIGNVRDLVKDLSSQSSFFGAGAITNAAIVLKTFEANQNQIEKLLPAAIKLSTLFGTDLEETTRKLAVGLTGATRGLREFGIVIKAGSSQAEIYDAILRKAGKANGIMNDANDTLAGSQRALAKAQGAYNKALGEFLAGPAKLFNNWMAEAYGLAAKLMRGILSLGDAMKPKPGNEMWMGAGVAREMMGGAKPKATEGGIPFARSERTTERPSRESRTRSRGEDPAAAAARAKEEKQRKEKKEEEDRQRKARQALEDLIDANNNWYLERQKKDQELGDAQLKRVDEIRKVYDDLDAAAQRANDTLLSGLADAGRLLAGIISGKADFTGFAKSIAGMIGGAFGGPIGSALASAGVDIASAIFDRLNPPAVAQKSAAEKMKEAADRIFAGSVNINEAGVKAREDALKAAALAAGLNASDIANAVAVAAGGAANIAGGNIGAFKELTTSVPNGSGFAGMFAAGLGQATVGDLVNAGVFNPTAIGQAIGGGAAPLPGASQQEMMQKQADMAAAFNALVDALKRSQGIGESPSAQDAQQLGDSARNPVYVFDVSPSKDEFTRAPRGLFFRPVGTGRAVETGSAVSAGAVRGSAGTYGAQPRRNLG